MRNAVFFILAWGFPFLALAANTTFLGPIVPACMNNSQHMCQACDLVQLGDNLLKFFVAFSVFAAAVMFAYAGFLYVTAASKHDNLSAARKIFGNVLIGLILVLAAWMIVDLTLRVLANKSLNVLTAIQCQDYTNTTPTGTRPTGTVSAVTNPMGTGTGSTNFCSDSQLPGFDGMIGDAINKYGGNLTSGDVAGIEQYCPNYSSMSAPQRTAFWTRYMETIAQYESSCNPNGTPFPESTLGTDSVTGLPVVSEGLFQLSYGSERGRARSAPDGTCYFDPAKQDIRDAKKNTDCAIFILNQDMGSFRSVDGATRYWSTARSHQSDLIAATQSVPGCR